MPTTTSSVRKIGPVFSHWTLKNTFWSQCPIILI